MVNGQIIVARDNGHVCMDCDKKIKIGEEYYNNYGNYKGKVTRHTYCIKCKNKPEHNRVSYDYEAIVHDLNKTPLFKHEFEKKYALNNSAKSNKLIRRLMYNAYPVAIFRWRKRSTNSKISEKEKYRSGHQPNDFIIYYIRGTENKVVSKILDEFDFEHIRWRDLLGSLYGRKIPIAMTTKETIKQWAEQNVY